MEKEIILSTGETLTTRTDLIVGDLVNVQRIVKAEGGDDSLTMPVMLSVILLFNGEPKHYTDILKIPLKDMKIINAAIEPILADFQ